MRKKQKGPDPSSLAWVSCLWAQYNVLPEPFKKSFFALAQNIAKETREQCKRGKNGVLA
jgi:hypothetical protein